MGKDEKFEKRCISLDVLDQNKSVDQEDYRVKLKEYQLRLLNLQRVLMESRHSVVVVVEGPDAAGKGGVIKRLVEKLDPRTFRVYSIVKPTQEEYAHHYLWRFWSKLPPYGQIAIFDRSWYGRVLVERVEGFASGASRGAEEMFEQTGTPFASWTVVEANFKWYARLKFKGG